MKKIFFLFLLNVSFFNLAWSANEPGNFTKNFYMKNVNFGPVGLEMLETGITKFVTYDLDCVEKDDSKFIIRTDTPLSVAKFIYNVTVGLSISVAVNASCPRHDIVDLKLKSDSENKYFQNNDEMFGEQLVKNNIIVELITINKHTKKEAIFRFPVSVLH